jgi:pyridoxamine 5'-phosphate oxidase family protein
VTTSTAGLTTAEIAYLASQPLGRLATVRPDGSPQVNPIGYRYNPETGTVDVGGFTMSSTAKFRNVAANGRVALVVDDLYSRDPWRVRFLEIRGRAEALPDGDRRPDDPPATSDPAVIRIHPERVIAFGIDNPDVPPHEQSSVSRTISADGRG